MKRPVKDTSRPAFPCYGPFEPGISGSAYYYPGMTLLEHYAGLAMQSCFAGPGAQMVADRDTRYDETNWAEIVAENAFDMAEAMIAERKKRHE